MINLQYSKVAPQGTSPLPLCHRKSQGHRSWTWSRWFRIKPRLLCSGSGPRLWASGSDTSTWDGPRSWFAWGSCPSCCSTRWSPDERCLCPWPSVSASGWSSDTCRTGEWDSMSGVQRLLGPAWTRTCSTTCPVPHVRDWERRQPVKPLCTCQHLYLTVHCSITFIETLMGFNLHFFFLSNSFCPEKYNWIIINIIIVHIRAIEKLKDLHNLYFWFYLVSQP